MYEKEFVEIETTLESPLCEIGESIEEKVRRVTTTNEPIEDSAPMIYTDRKDGVKPQYDIRTDRFDIAIQAMDKVTAAEIAKRQSQEETATNEEQPKE